MKAKIFKSVAIVFVTVALSCGVKAQEEVYEIPIPTSKSIIRNIVGNEFMIYNENGMSSFFVRSNSPGAAAFAPVTHPFVTGTNDVRVLALADMTYFCGTYTGNVPFFGFIPTFPVSSVNVPYYVTTLPAFGQYTVTSLSRMTVYQAADMGVHIIMIGTCASGGVTYSCIIDAFATSPNSTTWDVELYTLGKEDVIHDDVAVSNNYIAVSCRWLSGSNPQKVYFFNKPTVSTVSMFTISPMLDYAINNFTANGPVAISSGSGDVFQTACPASTSTVSNGLMISEYNAPNNTSRKTIDLSASGMTAVGGVIDMSYDITNTLYVLQQVNSTAPSANMNVVFKVDSGVQYRYRNTSVEQMFFSLDKSMSYPFYVAVSGISAYGQLTRHNLDFTSPAASCSNYYTATYYNDALDIVERETVSSIARTVTMSTFPTNVIVAGPSLICN